MRGASFVCARAALPLLPMHQGSNLRSRLACIQPFVAMPPRMVAALAARPQAPAQHAAAIPWSMSRFCCRSQTRNALEDHTALGSVVWARRSCTGGAASLPRVATAPQVRAELRGSAHVRMRLRTLGLLNPGLRLSCRGHASTPAVLPVSSWREHGPSAAGALCARPGGPSPGLHALRAALSPSALHAHALCTFRLRVPACVRRGCDPR